MFFKEKDGDDIFICCDCGCENGFKFRFLKLKNLPERYGYAIISSLGVNTLRGRRFPKLSIIWNILRGRNYDFTEIVVSREEIESLRDSLNEVLKKDEG